MYIDNKKKKIYYFDSVGDKPPNEIIKLVKKIQYQANELSIKLEYRENYPFSHQKGNTECGIYVLYFITEMLEGNKNFDYFTKNKISDDEMEKYRKIFFN